MVSRPPTWLLEGLLESSTNLAVSSCGQGLVSEDNAGRGGLWRFALLSEELTFHLQQLQRQTEQELCNIQTQWVSDVLCARDKEATVCESTQSLHVFVSVYALLTGTPRQGGGLLMTD